MKRLLMSMFLTMVLLTPVTAKADVDILSHDISSVFNESSTGNEIVASVLSLQEMEETEGALAPLAIYAVRVGGGAVLGALGSAWNHRATKGSWKGAAGAAGRGAAIGAAAGAFGGWLKVRGW